MLTISKMEKITNWTALEVPGIWSKSKFLAMGLLEVKGSYSLLFIFLTIAAG
jgi:hypothetical protein